MNKEESKKYHREYMRKWTKENREKDREIHRKYREKNREKVNKSVSEWRKRNPDKIRESYLKRDKIKKQIWKYPITKEEYNTLILKQNNTCAICKMNEFSGKALSIDHDHTTNVTRGLLCGHCNRGLGLFKDNPDILKQAILYLKEHK